MKLSLIEAFSVTSTGNDERFAPGGTRCISTDGITKLGPQSNGGGSGGITQDGPGV